MRITLVQAPRWNFSVPSYAVALLTGNLRSHGFTTFQKCFDLFLLREMSQEDRRRYDEDQTQFWSDDEAVNGLIAKYSPSVDRMVEEILADRPDLVGFSVKWWSRCFSLAIAARLKRLAPQTWIVFGGAEMNVLPASKFLKANPQVDVICRQEADRSFPRFLEKMESHRMKPQKEPGFAFRNAGGGIVDCGPIDRLPDLATVPFADYSDYDFGPGGYRAITMALSRGCINRCSFCSESPLFSRFRAIPAERVFQELLHHAQTTNCGRPMQVAFCDSLINGEMAILEALADLLVAHRDVLQIRYGGPMFLRPGFSEELVRKLASSGLTEVMFGLESGSETVLKRMRKRIDLAGASQAFERFHRHKVVTTVSAMFGHPGETEAEFHTSLHYLRTNAHNIDRFLLGYLGLYGRCDISNHPQKYGIDPDTLSVNDWVGDEGRNTFAVRAARVNLARLALGEKVLDIGGFVGEESPLYDPATPHKARIAQLTEELAHASRMLQARAPEPPSLPSQTPSKGERTPLADDTHAYGRLTARICRLASQAVPRGARVLVVSKGDEQLLRLRRGRAQHFPQDARGGYAGFYPAGCTSAIAHLEWLRARGATHLLIPSTALWWLDQYPAFAAHLQSRCRALVRRPATCLLYALKQPRSRPRRPAEAKPDGRRPTVSIIVAAGYRRHAAACLTALRDTLPDDYQAEIILVLEAGSDGLADELTSQASGDDRIMILRNQRRLGFPRSANRGARAASGELLVFLGEQTLPLPGWLPPLARTFEHHSDAAAVGGRVLGADGRLSEAGGRVLHDGSLAALGRDDYDVDAAAYTGLRAVDYCSLSMLATPRRLFKTLGGFDPAYGQCSYLAADYCFRLRQQDAQVCCQSESLAVSEPEPQTARGFASHRQRDRGSDRTRFLRQWRGMIGRQPHGVT
jgi:hypothetical protein